VERVVLPRDGAAGERRHRVVRQPGDAGEDLLDAAVAARRPDHVEMLVEPDRHVRVQAQDQRARDPRLALGQRVRPGGVDAAERPPADGEVPVQVDTVRVLARSGRDAVGVEVGDDPEIETARRPVLERERHRDPRGLVAVDAADDDRARPRRVADLDRDDRTSVPGAPELHRARVRRRRERERDQRERAHVPRWCPAQQYMSASGPRSRGALPRPRSRP
jgi:hypothetical protein